MKTDRCHSGATNIPLSQALYGAPCGAFEIQTQIQSRHSPENWGDDIAKNLGRFLELWDRLIAVNHALDFGVVDGGEGKVWAVCSSSAVSSASATSRILSLSLSFSPSLIFPHTPSSTTLLILTTFSQRSSRRPSQHSSSTTHHHPHP